MGHNTVSDDVFQDLMHSWVGYELVKVLLIFGLTPKVHDDLEDWSPDLFNVFTYMGNKKRDTNKEEADRVLTILFQKTQHNSYFTMEARQILKKCPILYYRW